MKMKGLVGVQVGEGHCGGVRIVMESCALLPGGARASLGAWMLEGSSTIEWDGTVRAGKGKTFTLEGFSSLPELLEALLRECMLQAG
jgi:hypothetical protein